VGGVARYYAPVRTVLAYLRTYYADDANGAYSLYCPESQVAYSESQQKAVIDGVAAHAGKFNLTCVRYTLVDENLTTADVRLGGVITNIDLTTGNQGTFTLLDNATDIFNLHSLGLGWCLSGLDGHGHGTSG
jgi:hypothetical protein